MRISFLLLGFLSLAASQQTHVGFYYELLLTNLEQLQTDQKHAGEEIAQNITLFMNNVYGLSACPDTTKVTGVYRLRPRLSTIAPFPVYCEYSTTYGDGWIVLERRFNGNLSFDRTWASYRNGFGSLQDEFWLGLEKMHQITRSGSYEALIVLNGDNGKDYDVKYTQFTIGSEFEKYPLKFGKYTANTADDELKVHNNKKFTTTDNNNSNNTCASMYSSGWWYTNCHNGNLNVPFKDGKLKTQSVWFDLRNKTEYLTAVRLMIRALDLN